MPAKSPAQLKLMRAVAHSAKFAKKVGISQSVGREFSTPGYAGGGPVRGALQACTCGSKKMASGGSVSDMDTDLATMSDAEYYRRLEKLLTTQRGGGARPEYLNASRDVNMPAQAARGWLAGTLGMPGDLESMGRGAAHLLTNGPSPRQAVPDWGTTLRGAADAMKYPTLPNTEFWDATLPGRDDSPAARAASGSGALFSGMGATPVVRGVKAVAKGATGALGQLADVALTPPGRRAAQLGAVRVKGGNFNEPRLAGYLGDQLNIHTPEYEDFVGDPLHEPRPEAVQNWGAKQLKNYIAKDLGTPTDPLLAVEKDLPGLHLPEGTLPSQEKIAAHLRTSPLRAAAHNELSGGAQLSPWGAHSDDAMYHTTPAEYADELRGWVPDTPEGASMAEERVPAWLRKATPDTKIWGLEDPQSDPLHFGHVLDYLEAATRGHEQVNSLAGGPQALRAAIRMHPGQVDPRAAALPLHDAGLTLDPASLSRLSIADAVRKTAQWNKHLAENGVATPGLEKGWQVHKEYPEEGMKWVKFGAPETDINKVPEGYKVRVDSAGRTTYTSPSGVESRDHPYKEALSEGLNAEGKAMGHCVGGYCDQVARNGTQIYSLRDAKGNPHVTIETKPRRPYVEYLRSIPDPDYKPRGAFDPATQSLHERVQSERSGNGDYEDYAAALLKKLGIEQPSEIAQIKGKQNAAPVEKYLPYVQDFVKSGKWSRVGDLRNSGLREYEGPGAPKGYYSEKDLWDLVAKHPGYEKIKAQRGTGFPRGSAGYSMMEREGDPEQLLQFMNSQTYAHGGSVQPSPDPHDELDHAIDVACIRCEGAH